MRASVPRMASKLGNITFDCADPRALAHFWADVFGYPRAEYPPAMLQQLRDAGATDADITSRWIAEDPQGVGPRLYFQRVPEGKVVKNRVHLDIRAAVDHRSTPDDVDAEVARLETLGASVVNRVNGRWGPFPENHVVMRDPEGNEFCVQ